MDFRENFTEHCFSDADVDFMSIQSNMDKAKTIFARHGMQGLLVYFWRFFFWQPYKNKSCRIFLFVLETPRPSPLSIKATEGHNFRFATLEDLEFYRKHGSWNIRDRDIRSFKSGDRCFLQFDGDQLVGYSWLAASNLIEIMWGFHFNIPSDTVYNYHGFTALPYRGKGFQPLRHLKMLEQVKRQGQKRLFGYVDQMNLNSLKGLEKSGYKKVGVLRCVKTDRKIRFFLNVKKDIWSEGMPI